mmetsp:Transcript_1453/g.1446  ORF Transcript_1453/g.1446 Transcript_1453/m.1446 type:complete len:148 (+) Transcript_1453:271-714(+)|eukprot:CAMPEP_0170560802 /NCGR_PEP_ID=MMETSP0211-20121228/51120_1 /TAXON_ID=311385 /ORGANISM="Pseudokeronopsis sp., Strain OXSARD2" /LENGTH=147 /DNA_ID=CAMNT_0010875515 /DNA_START=49 /DNA_END=492 /DNA_ORIENTATION=+
MRVCFVEDGLYYWELKGIFVTTQFYLAFDLLLFSLFVYSLYKFVKLFNQKPAFSMIFLLIYYAAIILILDILQGELCFINVGAYWFYEPQKGLSYWFCVYTINYITYFLILAKFRQAASIQPKSRVESSVSLEMSDSPHPERRHYII